MIPDRLSVRVFPLTANPSGAVPDLLDVFTHLDDNDVAEACFHLGLVPGPQEVSGLGLRLEAGAGPAAVHRNFKIDLSAAAPRL